MEKDNPKKIIEGSKFIIIFCKEAEESFDNALNSVDSQKKIMFLSRMFLQIERLANGERMSKENFPSEGNLPNGKKFYAFKRIPIRGYCWHSERFPNTYFISHFVYKNFNKLKPRDTQKVHNNWRRIEENGDEY